MESTCVHDIFDSDLLFLFVLKISKHKNRKHTSCQNNNGVSETHEANFGQTKIFVFRNKVCILPLGGVPTSCFQMECHQSHHDQLQIVEFAAQRLHADLERQRFQNANALNLYLYHHALCMFARARQSTLLHSRVRSLCTWCSSCWIASGLRIMVVAHQILQGWA